MGVSSALWVIGPYITKLLIDSMTKTIEASMGGVGVATSIGLFAKIKAFLMVGSEVKGGLSLSKMIGGLGLLGLVKVAATTIY